MFAVDGVNSSDNNRNVMLNLGIYDISNNVPINVTYYGSENRNAEVRVFISYIKSNMSKFENAVFVADRLYFNYELLKFLHDNNLKFIIRVKGSGDNLDSSLPLKKNVSNYGLIKHIKDKVRMVKCKKSFKKTVYVKKDKKFSKKVNIDVKNDCVLVTNLMDTIKYSDDALLNYYRSRWDIEVYFKFIKNNFKFQNMNEKDHDKYKKLYLCELILTYIVKLIERYFENKKVPNNATFKKNNNTSTFTKKINKSNIIKGLFDSFLYDILNGNLDNNNLDSFCKAYIVLDKNKINRSFPRTSKTPFTKWYVKGYSEITKYSKIIKAIIKKKVNKLNKNLKVIANKIISIIDG